MDSEQSEDVIDLSAPDEVVDISSPRDEPGFAMGAPDLAAAVEALLIVADEALAAEDIASLTGRPVTEVEDELLRLADEYEQQGRGFTLRRTGGGWRFYTSDECSDLVTRFVTEGQSARLSQAALETLSVIAYRQPVTRSRIGAVRGVNVDGVVRTLQLRGLIEQVGTEPETGAGLYGTTAYFLERLGIDDLAELPPLAEHVAIGEELDELVDSHE